MLDRNALQVFGLLQNVGFERAEDAEHPHGLFAAGVEAFDFLHGNRGAGIAHEVDEGFAARRAEKMAVELRLRKFGEEIHPFRR